MSEPRHGVWSTLWAVNGKIDPLLVQWTADPSRCAVSGAALDTLAKNVQVATTLQRRYERRYDVAFPPEPEIPVTEEMIAAANAVWNAAVDGEPLSMDIYRAMAAVAPMRDIDEVMEAADAELVRRNAALEAENAELKSNYAELEAFGRARILTHQASEDEWREIVDAKDDDIAKLTARVQVNEHWLRTVRKKYPEAFTGANAVSADLPDSPRRPDGTLAPAAKPLPVLKPTEPSRRIGEFSPERS